jgi:hypothetical protein
MLQASESCLLRSLGHKRRASEDLLCPPFGNFGQGRDCSGFIDQPKLKGTGSAKRFTCYNHRQCHMMGQLTDCAMNDTAMVNEPRSRFWKAKLGIVCRKDDVGAHRKFEAQAKDMAMHHANQWFLKAHQPPADTGQPATEREAVLPSRRVRNVCAGAKRSISRTGEKRDTDIGIPVNPRPDFSQRPIHLSINGIED